MLRSLKFKLDKKSLEIIYLSFIRPKLEYGDVIFAGAHKKDLAKLSNFEYECIRIISGATARCNRYDLSQEVSWPLLEVRRNCHVILQLYKIMNGMAPDYLTNIFGNLQALHPCSNYQLRTRNYLKIPKTKLYTFSNSFFPFSFKLWNKLDQTKKDSSTSVKILKKLILTSTKRSSIFDK
jgi:hypothetical protein